MGRRPDSYILNKESDFARGYNAVCRDDVLVVDSYYFTYVFDGLADDARWYKLCSEYNAEENSYIRITIYSMPDEYIEVDDKSILIYNFANSSYSLEEKKAVLKPYKKKEEFLSENMLITDIRGRYVLLLLESITGKSFYVKQLQIYFGGLSFIKYLPEVYQGQENSFLERYLYIFQNIFENMERQIENSPQNYSAETESYEFLKWLSSWYGITHIEIWDEEKLRYILRNASRIYSMLGTRDIIEEILGLYLGEKPLIFEYFERDKYDPGQLNIKPERIFSGPYVFTVIIRERALTREEYRNLFLLAKGIKPAHMEMNVICMKKEKKEKLYVGDSLLMQENGTLVLS